MRSQVVVSERVAKGPWLRIGGCHVRPYQFKLLAIVGAACVALCSLAPVAAQPTFLLPGPDGQGPNTYIGRLEQPVNNATVDSGSNLTVTGWAADTTTTAVGFSGFDGVEVWNGAKDKGGTKLATGTVALQRPDIAEALGNSFLNSGFNVVVPASALNGLSGAQTLFVYLQTPGKGSWYTNVAITLAPIVSDPCATPLPPPTCSPTGGGPNPGTTPELDSLVLFGGGLSGLGAYALARLRARRRRQG